MGIKIAEHTFDGPFGSADDLEDRVGVYAIICKKDDGLYLVDVGESAKVKTSVETHDRKDCWNQNCQDTLVFAAHYTPDTQQSGRKIIEVQIRSKYKTGCGEG